MIILLKEAHLIALRLVRWHVSIRNSSVTKILRPILRAACLICIFLKH
jgi:hypothetical protein